MADTFDAINSFRPYRGARSPEKSLEIVEEVAGSQLDPKIVEVFKTVYEENRINEKEEKKCLTVQKPMTLKKSAAIK